MKFLLKNYVLFLIAASLVWMPMQVSVAKEAAQKTSYAKKKHVKKESNKKKARYKRARARRARLKARRLALAKQRATDLGEHYDGSSMPHLASNRALVVNQNTGEIIFAKNTNTPSPIASITKLMTAMVVLDAQQSLDETIYISEDDVDKIKGTRSRLPVGTSMARSDMLLLALMSSENRAAYALASNYPGGQAAFVKAMNAKALSLGLMSTRFAGPTGLMFQNVSTAEDLYNLVSAAQQYPEIVNATTTPSYDIYLDGRERAVHFKNTNAFVRKGEWDIGLSKTGFINEAGRCIVMQATLADEPVVMVFLDAAGTNKRTGDANRIRKWLEYNHNHEPINTVVAGRDELQPKLVMSSSIYEN